MWFTRAELGNFVLALPVRFTPLLYTDDIRAARARSPVVIERQKNWCWVTLLVTVIQKRPIAMPIPRPMSGGLVPFCIAAKCCSPKLMIA